MNLSTMTRRVLAVGAMALLSAGAAWADCEYTLFGAAELTNGSFQLTSDTTTLGDDDDFGGIDFEIPAGTMFAELESLGAAYDYTDDTAGGGSPRFQINLAGGNVFVYLGTPPAFTGAGAGDTGELLDDASGLRFDLTQVGGPFYATYSQAVALVGGEVVEGVQLVVDGGWAQPDNEQTVRFDNIRVHDCVIADADDDGVPDDQDHCIPSDLRPKVDVNGAKAGQTSIDNVDHDGDGCTIQDDVNAAAQGAKNHGQYVSAVTALANELRQAGVITNAQATEMKTGAAQSDIGKKPK